MTFAEVWCYIWVAVKGHTITTLHDKIRKLSFSVPSVKGEQLFQFLLTVSLKIYTIMTTQFNRILSNVEATVLEAMEKGKTFGIQRTENLDSDDAFIVVPSDEATKGHLVLLVDSGADTSLVKLRSLAPEVGLDGTERKWLSGPFGGDATTEGAVEIEYREQPNLAFRMHVVSADMGLPADGLVGRDTLWNRSIIDTTQKKLTFVEEGNHVASFPLVRANGGSRICVAKTMIVQPRSQQEIPVRVATLDTEVVIFKKEIKPGVYVGDVVTRITNGIGFVPLINTQDYEIVVDSLIELEHSIFGEFMELELTGNGNILTMDSGGMDVSQRIEALVSKLDKDLNNEEFRSMQGIYKDFYDGFHLPSDRLTHTDVLQHEIPIMPGTAPINTRQYRLPEAHKDEINRQVNEMLEQDIIVPSKSPWNSPIILVPKKAGADGKKKWRLVVDFRRLNEKTIKTVFPIPRIDEILDQLGKSQYFSTLDLASGYHQVLMDEKDRGKTAFSTGMGHFEFKRMPFGLTGSPATFQRIMNSILTGLQGLDCFVYLDDIVVYGKDLEQHERRLRKVLQALRRSNLKLNPDKCHFLRREIIYLGHKCSKQGVSPDPGRVECVKNIPPPKNVKQLQSFLGLVNYYRKFIPNAARIALPLTELLKKEIKFEWTNECQKAMEELKRAIINPPILRYVDFSQTLILTTDASGKALGAVLSQGEPGKDLPIYFASRALKNAEINYSATEKEMLAIVWATKLFRPYL